MQFQTHETGDLLAALRGHSLDSRLLNVSSELQGHAGRNAAIFICSSESKCSHWGWVRAATPWDPLKHISNDTTCWVTDQTYGQ